MRYRLRSSSKNKEDTGGSSSGASTSNTSSDPGPSTSKACHDAITDGGPPEKKARMSSVCRRKVIHKPPSGNKDSVALKDQKNSLPSTTIMSLGVDVILHLAKYLDSGALISLYKSCHYFYDMLRHSSTFWKFVCQREELSNYDCLNCDKCEPGDREKLGWAGKLMRVTPPEDYDHWRKVYLRGLQMRKNIVNSNFEGWRIFANTEVPVAKLTPDLDLNEIKQRMGNVPKLSVNDDLKIDWDDKQLVVFHFFR